MKKGLKPRLTKAAGVATLAAVLFSSTAMAQVTHPWMTVAIIDEQAAANDDAAREAIAKKRAKLLLVGDDA